MARRPPPSLTRTHLVDTARAAEDTASAFFPFLDHIPPASAEISAIMAELFAISSQLRVLSDALYGPNTHTWPSSSRTVRLVLDDLDLVLASLSITLAEIGSLFERLRITGGRAAYPRVWREIRSRLREGSLTLRTRLETYRTFLVEVFIGFEGSTPGPGDVRFLRQQIGDLLAVQEDPFVNGFRGLSLGGPETIPGPAMLGPPLRRRSYRSRRPATPPPAPEVMPEDLCPPAPEPPPIARPPSSASNSIRWAVDLFDGRNSITPFSTLGKPSKCQGEHNEHAETGLSRLYDKLAEIEFDDGVLVAQFYFNPRDSRTKMLCLSGYDGNPETPKTQSYQSLNTLRIAREESSLLLYTVRTEGESRYKIPWTRLNFTCYERLVLTFLLCAALKAQGPPDSKMVPNDFKLGAETELRAFKIEDDGYLHALRILKDRHTGGVRLEASALRGELKGMPVWTAFVTQYIGSSSWVKRASPKTVQLAEFHPYLFSSAYTPPRSRTDRHEIKFANTGDANDFVSLFRK